MKTIEKILPAGFRFRELWLPEVQNNSATIPSLVAGGQKLTNTGARNGTTADGVHFTGAATSNAVIAAAAANNNKAAFHITIRFKLDKTFAAGAAGNFYFLNKVNAATYIRVYLKAADGKLYWEQDNGAGGAGFSLTSTTVSWTAGTWYTITCSMTDTPTQRLLVNGTAEDTDTSGAVATPNGGNVVLASSSDGGTDGVVGVISLICIGTGATATVALTTTEETDLYKGVPPATAKVQYLYLCDEGVGTTLVDRSATAANATLDSACTWAFGRCKQACISLEGINDYLTTPASVDLSGDVTIVWVGKLKSTYASLSRNSDPMMISVDGDNYLLVRSALGADGLNLYWSGGAVLATVSGTTHTIDNYAILGFVKSGTTVYLYQNGAVLNSGTIAASPVGGGQVNLGRHPSVGNYDPSKPITIIHVEGALSAAQVKQFSRTLDQMFNLGIGV